MIRRSTMVFMFVAMFVALSAPVGGAPLKGGVEQVEVQTVPVYDAGIGTTAPFEAGIGTDKPFSGGIGTTKPLSGAMRFSEEVDPIPPKLRPGRLFAEANLPAERSEDGWYQIPQWRAGKFHRETQTDHTLFGDVTIVSRVDHVYGMQRDKKGGIWHHESWPQVTKVEMDGYVEYKLITRYQPVRINATEFCVRTDTTDFDVDVKTGKIKRVTKQEEFDRYFPAANGITRGEIDWQGFSMNGGRNTTPEHTSLEEERIEPFRVINTWKGKDLRDSFRRYLESHGMAELIPE